MFPDKPLRYRVFHPICCQYYPIRKLIYPICQKHKTHILRKGRLLQDQNIHLCNTHLCRV